MSTHEKWRNRIVRQGNARVDDLIFNPLNWRVHGKDQQEAMVAALDDIGWIQTIVINIRPDGTEMLLDGHMRVLEADKRGEQEVPAIWVELSESEETKALLTLDPIGAMAGKNKENLDLLLRQTSTDQPALQQLLSDLADSAGLYRQDETDTSALDAVAEAAASCAEGLQVKWQTAPGQIWEIPSASVPGGVHRLMCGSSTDAEHWALLADGRVGDMLFTDPPYGVDYEGAAGKIKNDNLGFDGTRELVRAAITNAPLKAGAPFYVCTPGNIIQTAFQLALLDAKWELRQTVLWLKDRFALGRQDYHWRHEAILYGWTPGAAHYFVNDRTQDTVILGEDLENMTHAELLSLVADYRELIRTTVFEEPKPQTNDMHPTMKPVRLVARAIRNSSRPGELVVETFGGSGSTAIAAEETGRLSLMMELDPKFTAVELERFSEMNLTPRLVHTLTPARR